MLFAVKVTYIYLPQSVKFWVASKMLLPNQRAYRCSTRYESNVFETNGSKPVSG